MKYAISVPIGAWNDFLPFTLESLKQQSEPMEIALLDASNDPRVKEIADQYDDILTYRRHGPDGGQSDAIIEGWDNTSSEFIGWLNADDSLFPTALKQVSECLARSPDLDAVYGHSTIVDNDDRMTGYHFNVDSRSAKLREGCIISQPSCLFRRSTFERVGGLNRDLHYCMDWDLWLRLEDADAKFEFLDAPLSRVLWDKDTKSASFNPTRRQELRRLIDTYTPEEKRDGIYKAFAIHAFADMVWPISLRSKVTQWLRRAGPKVFGIRADGNLAVTADLQLVHYQTREASGLTLEFDNNPEDVGLADDDNIADLTRTKNQLKVRFKHPVGSAQAVTLKLVRNSTSEEAKLLFQHAEWQF